MTLRSMARLVGPLGPEAVATAGMGSFWVNVTGVSMVVGFGIGMVPLASQAYGAGNYARVRVLLLLLRRRHFLVKDVPLYTSLMVLHTNEQRRVGENCGAGARLGGRAAAAAAVHPPAARDADPRALVEHGGRAARPRPAGIVGTCHYWPI
jgi:hypothetical protein